MGTRVVRLLVEGTETLGVLDDSAPARAFADLLPLTLTLTDFHRTEKIADLPARLTTDGAPAGYAPVRGDLAYYSPWGNLAIFYRDFDHSPGLVRLGRVETGLDQVTGHHDDVTVTVTLAEETPGA